MTPRTGIGMAPTRLFTLRLSHRDFAELEQSAARQGVAVSTFARDRMMSETNWRGAFEDLQQEVRRLTAAAAPGGKSDAAEGLDPIAIETLLLLRRAAAPQVVAQVHGQMTGYGYAPFSGQEH